MTSGPAATPPSSWSRSRRGDRLWTPSQAPGETRRAQGGRPGMLWGTGSPASPLPEPPPPVKRPRLESRPMLRIVGLLVGLSAALPLASAADRPNIVLIYADDVG